MKSCFHCPYKWNCYDRQMTGRDNPCNNSKEQRKNWKWFELYCETPEDRKFAREMYINISKANNN